MATTYDDPTLVREPPGTPLPTPSPAAMALRDDALAQRAAAHDAAAVPAEAAGVENLPEEPPLPSGRGLTALADILRPPSEAAPPEEPSAPAPAPTGGLQRTPSDATRVANALLQDQMRAYERADVLRHEQAEAQAPVLQATYAAHQRFVDALGQSQKFPAQPFTTPPPSRKLRDFMDPIDGEHPAKAIGRLIQAMGLFAMGIGGMAKGYVGAGLAGLVGAMQGWQEGDAVRADRAFADWKDQTEHAVKEWEREKNAVESAMKNATMELEQRFKLVELTGLMYQNQMVADLGRAKDLDGIIKHLTEVAKNEGQLDTEMIKVFQAAEDRRLAREQAAELARERLDFQRMQAESNNLYKAAMLKLQEDTLADRKAGRADAALGRRATLEDKLRADYMAASKNALAVRDAFERVKVSARPSPTGERAAGDMSMVYAFMKMLDPESVVREAEQRMAMQAGSFAEKAKAWVAHLQTGAVFTDKMRADFLTRAEMLYIVAKDQQIRVTNQFRAIAQGQELNVQSAVPDLFGVGGGPGTSPTPDFSSWPVREKK